MDGAAPSQWIQRIGGRCAAKAASPDQVATLNIQSTAIQMTGQGQVYSSFDTDHRVLRPVV